MFDWRMRDVILAVVVLASTATLAGAVSFYGIPAAPCAGIAPTQVQFTIVANLTGYNNSKLNNGQGPFFSVPKCSRVTVNLANRDVQPHGLAVDFYSAHGVEAIGGDTQSLPLLAYKTGTFRIFCNIYCSVHTYMLHAQLTVTCPAGRAC